MGYGKNWQIGTITSGRKGPKKKKDVLKTFSEARNCITIENDENPGLDARIGEGGSAQAIYTILVQCREYIKPSATLPKRVIDSWRGVRSL